MTREETTKVLVNLKILYPQRMNRYSQDEKRILLNLWSTQFKDDSYEDVMSAIHYYISTKEGKFFPDIYTLKEIINSVAIPVHREDIDASKFNLKLENGIYRYGDKFNESYDWKNDPLNIKKRSVYTPSMNDGETEAERQELLKKAIAWQKEIKERYE